ncbi:hypothetical protein GCK72_010966 [Caenorhabditis remanei]|uniref:JmjC domain-containing protein n=1 Tax=Caenorhabditis remanei TaxID=31234 RepID=A0A6A5H7E6_CAERE|nr:hypothetical protein GCK72_010966 [Caenorhabditis remanei]KAF1762704.1 hypothetical protein GCK72_010966 [Caenorhabditis remanei]
MSLLNSSEMLASQNDFSQPGPSMTSTDSLNGRKRPHPSRSSGEDDRQTDLPNSTAQNGSNTEMVLSRTCQNSADTPANAPERILKKTMPPRKSHKNTPIPQQEENYPPGYPDKKTFRDSLKHHPRTSQAFVEAFKKGEHIHFHNKKVALHIWEDGQNYMEKIGDFTEVHLFKSREGLDMKVPKELGFDTLTDYIPADESINVIDGYSGGSQDMTMGDLLEEFKKEIRTHTYNVLSLEFSEINGLNKKFNEPAFVRQSSIVNVLETVLKRKADEIERRLKRNYKNPKELAELLHDKYYYEAKLKNLPSYQKFLLVSMKNAFTDIHVDLSATAVYYHVKKGRKVFYVAPPTARNLEIYKRYETAPQDDDVWIGEALFDQWKRVEIKEGFTAIIPAGWIHFVYTPEDSIVVGGNFLMNQYLDKHFEFTEMENTSVELNVIDRSNMFRGFYNVMWGYADEVLLRNLKNPRLAFGTYNIANDLHKCLESLDLDKEMEPEFDWYTKKEKEDILVEMNEALNKYLAKKMPPQPETQMIPIPKMTEYGEVIFYLDRDNLAQYNDAFKIFLFTN